MLVVMGWDGHSWVVEVMADGLETRLGVRDDSHLWLVGKCAEGRVYEL
jgi:hypothetical protein